jgi:hypothetical protein
VTYELNRTFFVESGPTILAARTPHLSSARFRAWRQLNPESRLEAVERALGPASNDNLIDGVPVAL